MLNGQIESEEAMSRPSVRSFILLILLSAIAAKGDLCSNSFCKCPEAAKIVSCECESQLQNVNVNIGSLPKQTESLLIRRCGEVNLSSNSFQHNNRLRILNLHNLNRLHLETDFFSTKELIHSEMNNLTITSIGELEIKRKSFRNFPKCSNVLIHKVGIQFVPEGGLEILTDNFILNDNNIGILRRSSLYSDATNLTIISNRIEHIESGAFDASVRFFNFIENTVDKVMNNGISVAFQEGIISNNTFTTQNGSPFQDVGPDPSCTADPESDYDGEDQIVYNIVSNPTLHFSHNTFLNFTDELLNFPGANNVPLGSLHLESNMVKCDCESLLAFALLVDFDETVLNTSRMSRGDLLFRKEFYDTGLCITSNTREVISLKKFMRSHIVLSGNKTSRFDMCLNEAKSAELVSIDSGHDDEPVDFVTPSTVIKESSQSASAHQMISFSLFYILIFQIIYLRQV